MSRKREPLNIGQLVPEKRGRGRPRGTDAALRGEFAQVLIVKRVAALRLGGATRADAIAQVAEELCRSEHTVAELHKANLDWSLREVAEELDLLHRTDRYRQRALKLLNRLAVKRRR